MSKNQTYVILADKRDLGERLRSHKRKDGAEIAQILRCSIDTVERALNSAKRVKLETAWTLAWAAEEDLQQIITKESYEALSARARVFPPWLKRRLEELKLKDANAPAQRSTGILKRILGKHSKLRVACLEEGDLGSVRVGGDGKLCGEGIWPDILADVCERNGIELEYVRASCWGMLSMLTGPDKVDCVIPVFRSRYRSQRADFAGLAFAIGVAAVSRSEDYRGQVTEDSLSNGGDLIATIDGEAGNDYVAQHLGVCGDSRMRSSQMRILWMALHDLSDPNGAAVGVASGVTCIKLLSRLFQTEKNMSEEEAFSRARAIVANNILALGTVGIAIPRGEDEFRAWLDDEVEKSARVGGKCYQKVRDFTERYKGIAWKAI